MISNILWIKSFATSVYTFICVYYYLCLYSSKCWCSLQFWKFLPLQGKKLCVFSALLYIFFLNACLSPRRKKLNKNDDINFIETSRSTCGKAIFIDFITGNTYITGTLILYPQTRFSWPQKTTKKLMCNFR